MRTISIEELRGGVAARAFVYMSEQELIDHEIELRTNDVPYIPLPNTVDVLITDRVAPDGPALSAGSIGTARINPTAFLFPFLPNGDLVMTDNVKRGAEVVGGHIEPGETAVDAAEFEGFEEAGVRVTNVSPLGIFRSHSTGVRPDSNKYAWPYSSQQFFTATVVEMLPYTPNEECHGPVIISPDKAEATLNPKEFVLYKHALASLFPDLAVQHGFILPSPSV